MRGKSLGAAAVLAGTLAGCDLTGSDDREVLRLVLDGVEPLANGFHYEGWAILGGQPVSTGKFNVDAAGNLVSVDGAPIAGGRFGTDRDLRGATAVVITIEPAGDTDAVPAVTKLMAGAVAGGTAALAVSAPEALNSTFASASGKYILATPTNGAGSNELSGVWFIDNSGGTMAPGLSLPALPAGWRYEGWTVFGTTPLTTGKITAVDAADLAAPFSGPLPGPPFPGEDYLQNAPAGLTFPTTLAARMIVITIEPQPDDDPRPFTLKPLTGTVPASPAPMVVYDLTNQAAAFPSGVATIED